MRLIGILSFTDPVRPSVKDALRICIQRGIKVKMLTGDHLLTAHTIADRIELPHDHDQLFNGPDLEKLPVSERHAAYVHGAIFARLKPEQKLELVKALKSQGNIVAMTGDGINDAPALKLADIGISMGERATDVARSTAQLVLLKNDFGGIVSSIFEGQRVLKSLGQSFGYLIAFHIPIITIALFQSFLLNAPILLPIHIVLLELIVHPVSTFVFDESLDHLHVQHKSLISRINAVSSVVRGVLLTVFAIFVFYFYTGSDSYRSSLAVLALVIGNLGLVLAEKGGLITVFAKSRSPRTLAAAFILLALTAALAYVPPLARLFSISSPDLMTFVKICTIGLALGLISIET